MLIGRAAGNGTASDNAVAVGAYALQQAAAGQNVGVGYGAGANVVGGHENSFVGFASGQNSLQKPDAVNSTAIGAATYTDADNQVVIGNDAVTQVKIAGIAFSKNQLQRLLNMVTP